MPRVCVFDLNETLLDLEAMTPLFAQRFGDGTVLHEWFAQMLQLAFVSTITNSYSTFARLGDAALEMVADRRGVVLSADERAHIVGAMRELPAHEDARDALQRLQSAGIRLAALTNSTREVAEAQLTYAGLRTCFELVLSADTVRRLKPAPEPYHMAAERLAISISQVRLVAAHAWDVAGALRAGCAAAFVARAGKVLDPLALRPDIIGKDLREVAEKIVACEINHI